jgi:phosphatidylserine/phosphatidylglycerophosphate/cardiolipin synthase-like enzyme
LKAYGDIAASAQHALFMTFAFGIDDVFLSTYQKEDEVLRFALLDKAGSGRGAAKARQNVEHMRKQSNVVIAVGQNIVMNSFDRWVKELPGLKVSEFVRWVHTKFMLVDPLSDDPVVITGSANFSKASTDQNHENMLVIHGDKRVADIYLGEFMRQFTSDAFRDAASTASKKSGGDPTHWKPQDLVPDSSWVAEYFQPNSSRSMRRIYFAGDAQPSGSPKTERGRRVTDAASKNHDHSTRREAGRGKPRPRS